MGFDYYKNDFLTFAFGKIQKSALWASPHRCDFSKFPHTVFYIRTRSASSSSRSIISRAISLAHLFLTCSNSLGDIFICCSIRLWTSASNFKALFSLLRAAHFSSTLSIYSSLRFASSFNFLIVLISLWVMGNRAMASRSGSMTFFTIKSFTPLFGKSVPLVEYIKIIFGYFDIGSLVFAKAFTDSLIIIFHRFGS